MASERPEGSGSRGGDWAPSPELLEERELLSGLLDGLSDLASGAPVEEAAVMPDPGAEEPPAVIVPSAEVSASAVAAQAPASAPASLAADSSTEAPAASPAAPRVSVAVVEATAAPTAGSSHAPALTNETPAAVAHPIAPGAGAVDSLLAKVAVESESHANSSNGDPAQAGAVGPGAVVQGPTARHGAGSKATEAHAAAAGEARISADVAAARATGPAPAHEAHADNAPAAGSPSAHGAGMAENRLDGGASTDHELEFSPADEEAAQPHMMEAEDSSGRRTEEAAGQEMPTLDDDQPEVAEAPIERSLLQSAGDQTASDPSWVGAERETTGAVQAGEVRIADQAGAELVSRVSQLFDLVPNWPGVDLDALEDAARSQVEDGSQVGADFVDVVSTHDVSYWVTATVGTAVGLGMARRELGLQARDSDERPTDREVELCWSIT